MQQQRRIIRTYYILTALHWVSISFVMATYATFLRGKGLDFFEMNMVNMSFFVSMFVFEIPTGALADVFGRRVSFLSACSLLSLSFFLYASSETFWQFVLAEVI